MRHLPEGWVFAPLSEVVDVIQGQSPPGSSYNTDGRGLPFFQGKSEFGDLHPTVRQWTTQGTKFAEAGDVLISVRAPVGPTNVAVERCAIGRGLAALRARDRITPEYLLWVMRASEADLAARATGTTFAAITGKVLRSHAIPVAPLDEQRRIVTILEDHIGRLEAANTSLERVSRLGDRLKAAAGAKLWADASVCGSTRAVSTLGRLFTGSTPSTKRPEYYGDEVPW